MANSGSTGPRLRFQSAGEESGIFRLSLTQVKHNCLVRITGGCGYMSDSDGRGLYDLLVPAFDGFQGAMLYGGTRIVSGKYLYRTSHSITEVPPLIRKRCPEARIHGVIPMMESFTIDDLGRLIISQIERSGKLSIVHPDQDEVLVVQESVDKFASSWAVEYLECLKITADLRAYANWQSVLLCYNGGRFSHDEAWEWRRRDWPVILVRGSGRITDELAETRDFVDSDFVKVADKSAESVRKALQAFGVFPNVMVPSLSLPQ